MKLLKFVSFALAVAVVGVWDGFSSPPNDDFAKRILLTSPDPTLYGSFEGATMEPGEPDPFCACSSLWWSWKQQAAGLTLVTPPTNVPATVLIYTGSAVSNLTLVAQGNSRFSFWTKPDETYSVRLRSEGAQSESFFATMSFLERPSNWTLTSPVTVEGTNVVVSGSADAAPQDYRFLWTPANSLWWEWTSPGIGNVTFDIEQSTKPVELDILEQFGEGFIRPFGGSAWQHSIGGTTPAGRKFLIRTTGGDGSGTNQVVLRIRMPSFTLKPDNDLLANASALAGETVSTNGTLLNADREDGEPHHGNSLDYQTVWYRWMAPRRGNVAISAISPTGPRVAAYRGTSMHDLVRLATGLSGSATFQVELGDSIAIAVADGETAPFQLDLNLFPTPANDDFENALRLTLLSKTPIDNRGATKHPDEADLSGPTSSRNTMWFTWTSDISQTVTALVVSTNSVPAIGVYTGDSLTDLTLIAATNALPPWFADPQISFHATAGETYRFMVATVGNAGGHMDLLLSPGSPPTGFLSSLPANMTNVAGGTYDFQLSVMDADDDLLSATLMWGTNAYTISNTPFHWTLTNLAPGVYRVYALMHDQAGHVSATPFNNYRIGSLNDEYNNSIPVEPSTVTNIALAGSLQQMGEPFTASWWSFVAPSNATYLAYSSGTRLGVYEMNGTNLTLISSKITASPSRIAFTGVANREYRFAVGDSFSSPTATLLITNAAANDFFTNGINLSGTSGTVTGSMFAATMETGETNHTGLSMHSSTWWTWTAPASGTLVLDPLGIYTTRAVVYTGTSLSNLASVGTRLLRSPMPEQWIATVTGGVSYTIALASQGTFALTHADVPAILQYKFFPSPPNDAFSNAVQIAGETVTVFGNNFGATSETGETSGKASVWWKWTAPRTGTAFLIAEGFNPTVDVYTGSALANLVAVDWEWSANTNREVSFPTTAGQIYHIAIAGSQQEFSFTIRGGGSTNDDFANSILLAGLPATLTGDLFTATSQAGETFPAWPNAKSLWWSWTAEQTQIVTITPAPPFPEYQGALVFTGTNLDNLVPVPRIGGGAVTFRAQAGLTYQIAIVGYPFHFTHHVQTAIVPNEPPQVAFISPTNGQRFTVGDPIPVRVHAQDSDGRLSLLRSGYFSTQSTNSAETLTFVLTNLFPGETTLEASATDDLGVTIKANSIMIRLTPPNDDFQSREQISSAQTKVHGSNRGASLEERETPHGTGLGGASIWWSWTPSATGRWTIDTRHSEFDTVLSVYTGDRLDGLIVAAQNNDRRSGEKASEVTFDAIAGQPYHIAVDTADGLTGQVQLHLTGAPGNDALSMPSTLVANVIASGTTMGATTQTNELSSSGQPAVRTIWWSWTAPDSGSYFVSTRKSDFDTVLAVYSGTNVENLSLVASDDDSGLDGTSLIQFAAAAGQQLLFQVDGFAGDSGQVQLVVSKAEQIFGSMIHQDYKRSLLTFGLPWSNIEIEESTNLIHWRSLTTQFNSGGWFETPLSTDSGSKGFYRSLRR